MNRSEEAANLLWEFWNAHDKLNYSKQTQCASGLLKTLKALEENIPKATVRMVNAFVYSDIAEIWRRANRSDVEDYCYKQAKQELKKARQLCGFEIDSPKYTVRWWKGFRHKELITVRENIFIEHIYNFQHLLKFETSLEYARKCTSLLVNGIKDHHSRESIKILKSYFDIYLEAWDKR